MIAERLLMGLLLTGIAVGCGFVLYPFFSAILWAGILVFTTWPVFERIRDQLRLRRTGAAAVMVLLTAVLTVLPLALAVPGGTDDVARLRGRIADLLNSGLPSSPHWLFGVPLVGPKAAEYWNSWAADLSVMADFFRPYFGVIAENGLSLLLGIAGGVLQFVLALFIGFFFWLYGDRLAVHLSAVVHRVAGHRAERLITVTGQVVRGTVYGILGTAIVQGILTSFGLWLTGVPRPMLLGAVAGLLSVLPIGAPLIWIPSAVWLLTSGHTGWGIFLAVYGVLAISGSDNVIRPYFISRGAQLPFLLTLLGVLGGALAFGLLGIFLGPVLLGVGFTLVVEFAGVESPPAPGRLARLSLDDGVIARLIHQVLPGLRQGGDHGADEDRVRAGRDRLHHHAFERRRRPGQQRNARRRVLPDGVGEPVDVLGRERIRHLALVVRQEADAEPARCHDHRLGAAGPVDANQHLRRLRAYGTDGRRGQPGALPGMQRRHDRHRAGHMAQAGAEGLRIDQRFGRHLGYGNHSGRPTHERAVGRTMIRRPRGCNAPRSGPERFGRLQMLDRLAGLRRHHLGHQRAVTGAVIPLEAQQAAGGGARQGHRLRQGGLRPVARHVRVEDALHGGHVAPAHRITPRLRRAERLQMHVADARLRQPGGQQALGKARLAGGRDRPDIDQQRHPSAAQSAAHQVEPSRFVADGAQGRRGHPGSLTQRPAGFTWHGGHTLAICDPPACSNR